MDKESVIQVGIGFATGRKNFLKVLKTYIYNWQESGLTDLKRIRLHLFIAYDLHYSQAKPSDFTHISSNLAKLVDSIQFIDQEYLKRETAALCDKGVLNPEEADALFYSGYAAMRNAVLYASVQAKMDYLLFLDDDEYPLAVTHAHEVALWSGQQVLAEHLRYIGQADVTNGFHCGYISPIPHIDFNSELTEDVFRMFIEAISNDIINWDNLSKVMKRGGVTYADTGTLIQNEADEVPEINGCKFISGSNLCLNLTEPGRIYPFYNPPGARGEDTFLSTCLTKRKVLRIPVYAFHNGFSTYNYLLSGVLPNNLKPISIESRGVATRFYNACIGWVRYKPLLIYITDREHYQERIAEMKRKLDMSLPKIQAYFKMDEFSRVAHELKKYDRDVEKHYAQFEQNKLLWKRLINSLEK